MKAIIKNVNSFDAKVLDLSMVFGKEEIRGTISCESTPDDTYSTTVGFYGGLSREAKILMDDFDGYIMLEFDGYEFRVDLKSNPYNCDRCFATLREAIGYVSIEDRRFHSEDLGRNEPGYKMAHIHIDID